MSSVKLMKSLIAKFILTSFQLKEQFKIDLNGFFISKTSIVKPVSKFLYYLMLKGSIEVLEKYWLTMGSI